jgi:hypothetical protein
MTLQETLEQLEALGNAKVRAQNAKSGAGDNQFGVSLGDIRVLAKKIRTDHPLALSLWETGNVDAQFLAALLIQPKKLSADELERMVRSVAFVRVADWLNAYVVRQHPDKETLRQEWMATDDRWAARASAQQKPTTGYAPVNGLKMYYEVHGSGDPVVLLHGSFMTISNNWTGWIGELAKTRQVIAVEMQGHGRTADIQRDFSYESLADDVAALLDHLRIPRADLIGYSMGGGVALQCAIRHLDKVRKVVSISAVFRHDGWVQEALDSFPCTAPAGT